MKYLDKYKIFEEEEKEVSEIDSIDQVDKDIDLSNELKSIGKDLKTHGAEIQDMVMKIAQEDSDIKDKLVKKTFEDFNLKKYSEFHKTDEGVTLGLALSSGVILQGVGKLLSFFGKKLNDNDQNLLLKTGQTIEKYGHNIHHGIIKLINTILKPLIFWLDPKKQEVVCNVVFMGVLAIKISSGSFDPSDYKSFGSFVEGLLNGIKSTEIMSFIKDGAKGLISLAKSFG